MDIEIWVYTDNGNEVEHRARRGASETLCGLARRDAVRVLPALNVDRVPEYACATCLHKSAEG